MKGLNVVVCGDQNEYVGKGWEGADTISSAQGSKPRNNHESARIGNSFLYGATKGTLIAAWRAGERVAVRNSGYVAVVEGCGTNGCEYMTGGIAVILGKVGDNVGAGMTGGMAYVYYEEDNFEKAVNPDSVVWQRLSNEHYEDECKTLIGKHAAQTGSNFSKSLFSMGSNDSISSISSPKNEF